MLGPESCELCLLLRAETASRKPKSWAAGLGAPLCRCSQVGARHKTAGKTRKQEKTRKRRTLGGLPMHLYSVLPVLQTPKILLRIL